MIKLEEIPEGAATKLLGTAIDGRAVLTADPLEAATEAVLSGSGAYQYPVIGQVRSNQARLQEALSIFDVIPEAEHAGIIAGTSTTDLSDYFNDAVEYLAAHGRGELLIPAGTYLVQGISFLEGITFEGQGHLASVLKLPPSPAASMFVAPSAASFNGGGFVGVGLDGGSTTAYDGIDMSAVDVVSHLAIRDCDIHHFRRGYSGSKNDRWSPFHATRFRNCVEGAHVLNNHPNFVDCDFRDNGTGIGGGALYDMQVTGCRFAYNTYAVRPTVGPGYISASSFTGNIFYRNGTGLILAGDNTVVGNNFASDGTGAQIGVILVGGRNLVTGNRFRDEVGTLGWLAAAEVRQPYNSVNGNHFSTAGTSILLKASNTQISNNQYLGAGTPILIDASASVITYCSINSNNFDVDGRALRITGSNGVYYNAFNDNVLFFNGNIGADYLVTIPNTAAAGNTFVGNTARNDGGTAAGFLSTDGRASIITNNRLRNAPINLTATDANTVNTQNVST